ncbi:MAG: fibrobacter succinogenes major paralogous domain-containing protein [Bacteroidales bacterium]|jgi:uncharacterized protein (TIGR02145 family)
MNRDKKFRVISLVAGFILILASSCLEKEGSSGNTISDEDGNAYASVTIGTQVWMQENLATTKYNDGTSIPLIIDETTWNTLITPAYCWYNNEDTAYKFPYGALYNWFTVNTSILCPAGWHVSTSSDWDILINYLGGDSVAGGKLKEDDFVHWMDPNTGASNRSGFTAVPGGMRSNGFWNIASFGGWWSYSASTNDSAMCRYMLYNSSKALEQSYVKSSGMSVRCVKD